MKTYIKITLPGEKNGYIDTPKNAKLIIDEMVKALSKYEDDQSYEFKPIRMTEEEFNNLPDFMGF